MKWLIVGVVFCVVDGVVVGASVGGGALVDGLVLGSNEVLGNVMASVVTFTASAGFTSVVMLFSTLWVFVGGEVTDSMSRVGASVFGISYVFAELVERRVVDDGKSKMLSSWAIGSASVIEEIPFVFVFVRIILLADTFSLDDDVEGDEEEFSGLYTSS